MYPFISTKEEALNAVRASRYPQEKDAADFNPPGLRGRSPTNAAWYWGLDSAEYVRRADVWPLDPDGEILTVIQIEDPEGVKNIEEIISVPGIGAIFIGPSDLGITMGYPDTPDAPEIEEAIQKVLSACKKRNIPVGITTSPESIERRLREGFRFVTVGSDGGISAAAANTLQLGHAATGRQ
jgi:4-hydroxy-2-oxoheptanedioate aldolase